MITEMTAYVEVGGHFLLLIWSIKDAKATRKVSNWNRSLYVTTIALTSFTDTLLRYGERITAGRCTGCAENRVSSVLTVFILSYSTL